MQPTHPGTRTRPWLLPWLALWVGVGATEIVVLRVFDATWEQPTLLFWIVVIAASLCVVTSGAVVRRGWRTDVGETAVFGSFFMAASLLPLADGITVPGIVYGPNTATMATAFWAVPAGAIVLLPLIAPRARWTNVLMRQWKAWVTAHLTLLATLFTVALVSPNAIPVPPMGTTAAAIGVAVSLSVAVALSFRHLRLAWIAQKPGPLSVSAGAALVGCSTIVFLGNGPWTAGFWLAHALDITGVFAATILSIRVYGRSGSLGPVLATVEATTPLRALELGLDPLVHRFVAALEQKDTITRDHVVRTAHMAALVSEELEVPFQDLSTVILGALLHDVGKLSVPDEILHKPGKLDEREYATIRRHTVDGEELAVLSSAGLSDLGPIVRGHHERFDGAGYPDCLAAHTIPLGAGIVAVCDAYDAMANTRQYRDGMGSQRAVALLTEHAGSQWDPLIVQALQRVLVRRGDEFDGDTLADVGRDHSDANGPEWCGCADAVPDELTLVAR